MDYFNRLSSMEKRNALFSVVLVGGLVAVSTAWSPLGLPQLLGLKDAVPRTEAQKQGFPSQEDLPDYQPAIESNAGATPSYTTNSAFGK
jgi:hypothetical protein